MTRRPYRPAIFPVVCSCGWTGANKRYPSEANKALTRHQNSVACRNSPAYLTEKERATKRIAAARQALADKQAAGKPCTAHTGTCTCEGCRLAAADHESPLELGGRWVAVRGIRKWVNA